LLMLPGVTPAHKGLKPSGLSFIQRTFINLPFKAHTCYKFKRAESANMKQITSYKQQCNLKEKCKKMPASIYS